MRVFIAVVVAAIACFATVESLVCNKCSIGLLGYCLNAGNETCNSTSNVCYTSKAAFASVSSFKGFVNQGCGNNTCGVNQTSKAENGSLPIIGVGYTITTSCCTTDKCNPVDTSGASATAASLSVLSVAALGAVIGSYM
ncbi:unnamed protein product [Knipowitschia caucasica]|uniref:UPAR/Ly6 domain-containing protein n=1 Tax=Knipowitschia caucasica TaxID=637954 RepID=A0AAV2K4L0_KNICA